VVVEEGEAKRKAWVVERKAVAAKWPAKVPVALTPFARMEKVESSMEKDSFRVDIVPLHTFSQMPSHLLRWSSQLSSLCCPKRGHHVQWRVKVACSGRRDVERDNQPFIAT
jgi:hypothetical protein